MAIDFNGSTIATTATGYLENRNDWSEDLARHMAKLENIGGLPQAYPGTIFLARIQQHI